jgi:hypothetical protein
MMKGQEAYFLSSTGTYCLVLTINNEGIIFAC